jgi:hypothetical protein
MANGDILEAIEDEDLGSVRQWLESNTGRANINKILNSGKTVLDRAIGVAANYSARNTFAHRIVNTLREYGAQTAEELEMPSTPPPVTAPRTNIFEAFNYTGNNIFRTPNAEEAPALVPLPKSGRPPLAPRRPATNNLPSRKLNGIAFGPRRNKRNSRKRRASRRSRRN